MLSYICVGFALLGYLFTLKRYARLSIELAPFCVISLWIIFLYFGAYIHQLELCASLILISGNLLFIAMFFYLCRGRIEIFSEYLTPAFVITFFYVILLSLLSIGVHINSWDEFTQWGPHAKLVFLNKGFFTAQDVTIHKDYPPGGALFYYLFYFLGGFSETKTFIAQQLLILTPLALLIKNIRWKAWPLAFIGYSIILIILNQFHVRFGFSGSLYMDDVVGVFWGATLLSYFLSDRKISDILWLIFPIATLCLLKLKLYPFVLLIAGIIALDQCYRKDLLKRLFAVLALFFTALSITKSWTYYIRLIHTPLEWSPKFSLAKILVIFFHPEKLTQAQQITLTHFLSLWPEILWIIVIFSSIAALHTFLLKNKTDRYRYLTLQTLIILGMIAYLFGLLLMYLYAFTPFEAKGLAAFDRYFDIYLIGWTIIVSGLFWQNIIRLPILQKKKLQWTLVGLIIMLWIILITAHISRIHRPDEIRQDRWRFRQGIQTLTNAVKKVTPNKSKMFIVWQASSGYARAIIIYELTPRRPNLGATSFGKPYDAHDVWTSFASKKELLEQLGSFDYLLLGYTDQNFWQHYGSLFENTPPNLKPFITYQICRGAGFDGDRSDDCHLRDEKAYLFKIIHEHNSIQLRAIKPSSSIQMNVPVDRSKVD